MLPIFSRSLFLWFAVIIKSTPLYAHLYYSHGDGSIDMRGSVVETACGIAVESLDQTINMDVIPVIDIIRDGKGRTKNFDIKLENCILPSKLINKRAWHQFSVTFDGDTDGKLFVVSGSASGVGLAISDAAGHIAIPGKSLPPEDLIQHNKVLNYSIQLVKNNKSLKAGHYFSAIRYKLNYY